jgi:hypothetical protein
MSLTKPKSATELAFRYQRKAHVERLCKPVPILADA